MRRRRRRTRRRRRNKKYRNIRIKETERNSLTTRIETDETDVYS